jgi:hypothetical protein
MDDNKLNAIEVSYSLSKIPQAAAYARLRLARDSNLVVKFHRIEKGVVYYQSKVVCMNREIAFVIECAEELRMPTDPTTFELFSWQDFLWSDSRFKSVRLIEASASVNKFE